MNNFNNNRNWNAGYPSRNWNNNYNNNFQQQMPAKKSGVTYTTIRKGNFVNMIIVNAWNKSKSRGLITAKVAPYHQSVKGGKVDYVMSNNGHKYIKMMAEIQWKSSGHTRMIPCLMNADTKVIALEEIGMVISPNGQGRTSSGKIAKGYFGTFNK